MEQTPELQLNDHLPHNNDMADALPRRKMFSSSPVGDGVEVSDENRDGGMRTVKKLAKAIKADGKLITPKN